MSCYWVSGVFIQHQTVILFYKLTPTTLCWNRVCVYIYIYRGGGAFTSIVVYIAVCITMCMLFNLAISSLLAGIDNYRHYTSWAVWIMFLIFVYWFYCLWLFSPQSWVCKKQNKACRIKVVGLPAQLVHC